MQVGSLDQESFPETTSGYSPSEKLSENQAAATGVRISYFGDYELLEEVARGGMGVVFRARQVSLDRIVAVKMILAGELASRQEVARFRAEAEAAANLRHPNIVAIHEIGEHQGQQYFSMDFVEGKSLAEIVREGPLRAHTAASYVSQIAKAVQYAHQCATLHRDLKPSNVLIDTDGQVHITDFGLAKRTDRNADLTVTGGVLGTPAYMPPEQAAGRGRDIGPASDIYSTGAMLYELLTGRPPFRGDTPLDTLRQVLESDPTPPRSHNAAIPVDLATICLKCLEKQPARRYSSAGALAEDLDRFLNQQPIHARPVSPLRKLWGMSRRRPWLFTILASTLSLLLLGTVYWLWSENAYLRYHAEHPDYVRTTGSITAELNKERWLSILFIFFLAATIRPAIVWCRRRRMRRQPVPLAVIVAIAAGGVVATLLSLNWLARTIDAWVWEHAIPMNLYLIWLWTSIGVYAIRHAVREYEMRTFGKNDEAILSNEQLDEARRLILGKKESAALTYCQQMAASKLVGEEIFGNLRDTLREQYPDKVLTNSWLRGALLLLIIMFCLIPLGILFAADLLSTRLALIIILCLIAVLIWYARSLSPN